ARNLKRHGGPVPRLHRGDCRTNCYHLAHRFMTERKRRRKRDQAAHDGKVQIAGRDGDGADQGFPIALELRLRNFAPFDVAGPDIGQLLHAPASRCCRHSKTLATTSTRRIMAWRISSPLIPSRDTMTHASSGGSTVASVKISATGLVMRRRIRLSATAPRNAFRAP